MRPTATVATAPPVAPPPPLISDTVALTLVGVTLSVVVGILGYLFRRTISDIDQKITSQSEQNDQLGSKISALEMALLQYQLTAKDHFVSRDDFITRISLIDGQLEKVLMGVQQNQGAIYAIRDRETT